MLFGSLTECLGFFRCIDPTQAHPEKFVAGREHPYGVTIGYADNSS
jgi:hypothetical protein